MDAFFDPASYHFSWFAVPVVLVGGLNWALGLLTLRRERGSTPSITLLLMTLTIGVWLVGLGGAYSTDDRSVAYAWVKLSMLGTVFVPVGAFMHAAHGSGRLYLMRAFVAVGAAFSGVLAGMVLWTDWVLGDIHRYFWGYYPIYGVLGPVLITYYALFFVAGGILYRLGHRTTKSVTHRKRMRVRLAALALAVPATVDFLATQHIPVYPFGYAFILGYITLSTYNIWRYRLVDITPALAATQIIDTMAEGLLVVDRDGTVRVANGAAAAIWPSGRGPVGRPLADLGEEWTSHLEALADPDQQNRCEVTYRGEDGEERTAVLLASKLRDHLGEWVGTVYIIHDITERWRAEVALRRSEQRFRSLVQHASDLITVIEADTTIRYQSPAIVRILGYRSSAVVGQKLLDAVHPDDRDHIMASLRQLMARRGGTVTGQGRVRDSRGEWRHLEFTGTDQRANPAIQGLVLNVRDVTDRVRLEEELRRQALHDPLTQLVNRACFADRLEHALRQRERTGRMIAVLFMDLDAFKPINDTLGHSAGDALLVQVARRIERCLRPGDTLARLGGDEFAVLLEEIPNREEAARVAERIFDALQPAFDLDGRSVNLGASIGIAVTNGAEAYDADTVLRDADTAMYAAKARGRGRYSFFEPGMQTTMSERVELLEHFPKALELGEFALEYQPIFLLQSGTIVGLEGLLRWHHPQRGLLEPTEFIPLAEESGAIIPIGSWVLREACAQGASWQAALPADRKWAVGVNVSARQLQSVSFVDEVACALRDSGLAPEHLVLEITETVLMQDAGSSLERLQELKHLGVRLAIDDFGTGYASLTYLRQCPFDFLKVDQSFVADMCPPGANSELARAIIALGKTLGLIVVAEGIENEDQLARLRDMGCDSGQGFHLARPLPAEEAGRLLLDREPGARAA